MRRYDHCLFALLLILAASACDKAFDLDFSTDPKLFLQCSPGPGDTTVIQLNRTVPVGTTMSNELFLESADIKFRVNGISYYVERAVDSAGAIPQGCWFVKAPLEAGDEVTVEATVAGFNPISATTTIPPAVPEFTWKCTRDSVRVAFYDDPVTEDWYGLAVYCERTVIDLDSGQVKTVLRQNLRPLAGLQDGWWYSMARNYIDIPFNGWAFGYGWTPVRTWPDTGFSEQEKTTLYMTTRDITNYWGNYEQRDRFKVRLYRFSKEFFRYGVALDHARNNDLAEIGLAPAAYAYTNVTGGVGILAGWNVRETDWFSL